MNARGARSEALRRAVIEASHGACHGAFFGVVNMSFFSVQQGQHKRGEREQNKPCRILDSALSKIQHIDKFFTL